MAKTGTKDKTAAQQCTGDLSAVADALYAIGGKWKLIILGALIDEKKRFNDLQRAIPGISARVLSNEFKDLELNGFVKRIVNDKSTVIIEYEITEYSQTLHNVMQALND